MSPTNRTLPGPNVSTPDDWSGPETPPCAADVSDAAERPPGRASPTADVAANRKRSRLVWPSDTDCSRILLLLGLVCCPARAGLYLSCALHFDRSRNLVHSTNLLAVVGPH